MDRFKNNNKATGNPRGKQTWLLYPFLFAIYPVLWLFSNNLGQFDPVLIFRPLIWMIVFALIFLLFTRILTRDWQKAGLLTTLFIILFFSYGHVYNLLEGMALGGLNVGRHRYLLILWLFLFLIGNWWILKRLGSLEVISLAFNIFAIAAIIYPSFIIARTYLAGNLGALAPQRRDSNHPWLSESQESLPDIYYIILDGYARQDMLEAVYEFDNTEFLDFLTARGFYVAEKSNSNYGQTTLSLSSSLNMNYADAIDPQSDPQSGDLINITQALHDSTVRQSLESLGYTLVAFETGYPATEIKSAGTYLSPAGSTNSTDRLLRELWGLDQLSAFEVMFLQSSALRLIMNPTSQCPVEDLADDPNLKDAGGDQNGSLFGWIRVPCKLINWVQASIQHPYEEHRDRILFVFEKITDLDQIEGPRLVFAHLVVPHYPYVFGSDGGVNENSDVFTLRESELQIEDREKFIEGYRDQVIFVNGEIQAVIEKIITEAENPPIIILQADHGPNLRPIVFEPSGVSPEKIRFGILNAYYSPGCPLDEMYDTISPVNTFRVLFNSCFGAELDLLADRSYYSSYEDPLLFTEVTEILTAD